MRSTIPVRSEGDDQALLVILLGRLFRDSTTSMEVQSAFSEKLKRTLQSSTLHIFVHACNVEQGDWKSDGTVHDIYKWSKTARARGWSTVVFLDALTTRQLTQTTKVGELDQPSATIIHLKGENQPDKDTFYMQRVAFDNVAKICHRRRPIDMDNSFSGVSPDFVDIMKQGLILRDPYGPLCGDSIKHRKAEAAIVEVLQAYKLPMEIQELVDSYVHENLPVEELTELPSDLGSLDISGKPYHIQSLVHLAEDEQSKLQSRFQDDLRNVGRAQEKEPLRVVLHNWKPGLSATRRDISRLLQRNLHYRHVRRFCFYLPRLSEHDEPRLLFTNRWRGQPTAVGEAGIDCLLEASEGSSGPDCDVEEMLIDYTNAFPRNSPPWLPAGHAYQELATPAVFYLTNRLTASQIEAVEDELYSYSEVEDDDTDEDKLYCFAPWVGEDDGSPLDMWRLWQKCRQSWWFGQPPDEVFFVDFQSTKDGTVLVCGSKYVASRCMFTFITDLLLPAIPTKGD